MLRDFDAFGPQAQDCALGHFGRSLPEIESLFGKASPDEQLRYQLAFALWKYARGDLDGQRMARGKQVAELIKSMHEPATALLAALAGGTLLRRPGRARESARWSDAAASRRAELEPR